MATKTRRQREAEQAELEEELERHDYDIERAGTKIILPNEPHPMKLEVAIKTLERKLEDENTIFDVHEVIEWEPNDALVALNHVMREIYGWASSVPKMTFFGPVPPDLVTVKTGPKEGESVQVPCGRFKLPGIENTIDVMPFQNNGQNVLVIMGKVRRVEESIVRELAEKTRLRLRSHSIYKGKAIRLKCDSDGDVDTNLLTFIDTDAVDPAELVLNPVEVSQVETALWAPIMHTDRARQHRIPLKRGVLLEGTYGTGKTMTASVTSKVCVENGWTYIVLDDVRGLKEALLFAQRYQPAVVFAEDIDRVMEHRDQAGNEILNTIDGILGKYAEVITVLTTNHVERLEKAMLRPGRLDAVISVKPPESEAVQRLIRIYARGLVNEDEDLTAVGEVLEGNIPATVREVVERAKLSMVFQGREHVSGQDLEYAARGMAAHLELLRETEPNPTAAERLGAAFADVVSEATNSKADPELLSNLEETRDAALRSARAMVRAKDEVVEAGNAQAQKVGNKLDKVHENTQRILENL